MSDEFYIQMDWRCVFCQARNPGLEGAERESLKCVTCGAEARGEVAWIMPDDVEAAPRLQGESLRRARLGPNWVCAFCQASSRDDRDACEVCGASRHAEPDRRPTAPPPDPEAPAPPPPPPAAREPGPRLTDDAWSDVTHTPMTPIRPAFVFPAPAWAAFLGLLLLGLLLWLGLRSHHATVRVDRTYWHRTECLYERHDYDGEGWRADAPSDVFEWTACEERQSGTRRCHPRSCNCRQVPYDCRCSGGESYACNCETRCTSRRNGSASCRRVCDTCRTRRTCDTCYSTRCDTCYDQCPVYATWCRYRYHRWDLVRTETRSGYAPPFAWPGLQPAGWQRVERSEGYDVRFRDVDETSRTWSREVPEAEFTTYHVGERWRLEWNYAGGFRLLGRAP